jgi:signal transduction histidine kinase
VLADREQVPLSEEHAVVFFQCVRELLFNVLKHAGTDRATVQVTVEEQGGVRLSVHDRGRGFSPDALRRATEPGHLGLFAVRERMESIGGRMAIHTALGHGTTVTLSLEER